MCPKGWKKPSGHISQRELAAQKREVRLLAKRTAWGTRAKLPNGSGKAPAVARLSWMLADPCAYCGGTATTFDHIDSLKRGGLHTDDNFVRSCGPCNHEKSSRTLLMFLVVRAHRKAVGTWRRLPESKLTRGRKSA